MKLLFSQSLKKEIQRNLKDLQLISTDYENIILSREKLELKFKVNRLGKREILEDKARYTEELSRQEVGFESLR